MTKRTGASKLNVALSIGCTVVSLLSIGAVATPK